MAEPAVGAVSLLLGVIRKEAELLGGVGADVQFIKEEMESMRSFLAHLNRTTPPGGEHNEQVRTWMDQGGLRGYLWWAPWFLRKMAAQHRAASQLRELKDRACDVGERRSRYGVELPTAVVAAGPTAAVLPAPLWADQGGVGDYMMMTSKKMVSQEGRGKNWDQGEEKGPRNIDWQEDQNRRQRALSYLEEKWGLINEIERFIVREMRVNEKIQDIKDRILDDTSCAEWLLGVQQMDYFDLKLQEMIYERPLGAPLLLLMSAAAAEQNSARKKAMRRLAVWYDQIIRVTAKRLKEHMEMEKLQSKADPQQIIHLDEAQYANILREVFPLASNSQPLHAQEQDTSVNKQATVTTITATLGEDQMFRIKEMIRKAKQEILRELKGDESGRNQAEGEPDDSMVEETIKKVEIIKKKLQIKGIIDKIQEKLCPRYLIILQIDETRFRWEQIRNALSMMDCVAGTLVFTTTTNTQQAKEYCYPPLEPIDCSLVGIYHDAVLELTSQQVHEENYDPQIFRDILDMCGEHEFCMKIFVHALYANPKSKRSNEVLCKLRSTLQVSPKSLGSIAQKMLKFSYNSLSEEYKSCLLYLAIFPQGHCIRRSTLVGRWVVEGLITREDWPTSVGQAEQCFDELINRWLVYLVDIGATGKVKSCMVGVRVHEFIFKMAKKQHIVETRLSNHLARHFSIFNDLQLRSSDTIHSFFAKLSGSSQLSLLKVLDLEGCNCFGKNKSYIKDVCGKVLLLKYLSLRRTDVKQLPNEINNLHELEVLDIRQTKVHVFGIENLLLLKLKRLLCGHYNSHPSNTGNNMAVGDEKIFTTHIPTRIEKMVNMEVLSNAKARNIQDLKNIGRLWQLRKLGVTIDDKEDHFKHFLRVISDLHECLQSLSITLLPTTGCTGAPSGQKLPPFYSRSDLLIWLRYPPKLIESLSIRGTTNMVALLPLLAQESGRLAKVILTRTWLDRDDMQVLAKLPKLRCVKFRYIACTETMLAFKENEFQNLEYFLVEGSNWTEIIFEDGAARELKKIVLCFTNIVSVTGGAGLTKLEELELKNNRSGRLFSSFENAKQITKLTLRGTLPELDCLQILAKKPNIRSLVLLEKSCAKSNLTFNEGDFPKLIFLTIDCSDITEINFTSKSALQLEKIVWTFTKLESLSGINNLPQLKELEFNGCSIPTVVEEAIKKHKARSGFDFKHNINENQEQAKGENAEEDDDAVRFPFCCWNQV
ncbi:unnamed protein product [Urochloa decumbens]|uniref:Uncharacterized protein n=1 Tax=Urochloa decumbens TaxID=240449 RepID=A0ABC8WN71_9POAL